MLGVGQLVGPYEVLAPLGAGGMGQVFRARDSRLDRVVAVKVLPEDLATDGALVQRFFRESRALAALNHPNILAIFDVGSSGTSYFIVTELLDGETLRQQVGQGPLDATAALGVAVQLAQGLQAAHESGIVHRDLKPENVFVTSGGLVKLLDFGLARTHADPEPITQPGAFMGTPGYMAPEQARGQPVDQRADIFSFGALLYELLTGRRAFDGVSPMDRALAALTEEPPDLQSLCRSAPESLFVVVQRCLQKAPAARFASAAELLHALRGAQPAAQLEPTVRPGSAALRPALPAPAASLIGRDDETARLVEFLRTEARLVTLTGPGGVGKTRLALEIARRMAPEFDCGACFVELTSVANPDQVANAIAAALEVEEVPQVRLVDTVKAALRRGHRLLVLDNFEHLVEAAPVVGELLAAAPELRVLVTSRVLLHLTAESAWPVEPLTVPSSDSTPTPTSLMEYSAPKLFVERAQTARAGFEVTPENANDIVRICGSLEGIPLALELAAKRLRLLSSRRIADELTSSGALGLLAGAGAPRDLPERQRTLWSTIEWSHALLSSDAQKLFRRLSVFSAGFSLDDAIAVAGDGGILSVVDELATLVDGSLVQRVEKRGDERFTMLEMLREFGRKKLDESGETGRALEAHARHFLEAGRLRAGVDDLSRPNVIAALESVVNRRDAAGATAAVGALMPVWRRRGPFSEGCRLVTRILELGTALSPLERAVALNHYAQLLYLKGERSHAKDVLEESLVLAQNLSDQSLIGEVLDLLVASLCDLRQLPRAEQLSRLALDLGRRAGGRQLGRALMSAAWVQGQRGQTEIAADLGTEALSTLPASDPASVSLAHMYMGEFRRAQEALPSAAEHYRAAAAHAALAEDQRLLSHAVGNLASTLFELGKIPEAEPLLVQSLLFDRASGAQNAAAIDLLQVAELEISRGDMESAVRFLGVAEATLSRIGVSVQFADERLYRRVRAAYLQRASDATFVRAYEAGRRMSLDDAIFAAVARVGTSPAG